MMLRKWEDLPEEMQLEQVKEYYDILSRKKPQLVLKRLFDIVVSFILLVLLSPVFAIMAIAIKLDSKGPVFYRQERVTQYGKRFYIHKFRSMVTDADKGSLLTTGTDLRITRMGRIIRKYKFDEICQIIDVLRGTMTFVGTRPEVPRYVEKYTPEMMATLLMPAGITSRASVFYKDENDLLDSSENVEETYLEVVLPDKMKYNLEAIKKFNILDDIKVIFITVFSVFK